MTIPTKAAGLAAAQGGHVSRRQLAKLGMSEAAISRRVLSREFRAIADGVYRLFETTEANDPLHGAVLALPDAVVSHESAARIHSIRSVRSTAPVVSVDASTTHVFPGVTVRRNRDLRSDHRTRMERLPVTTLARTVFDLAAVLSERQLDRVVDEVVGERRLTIGQLDEMVQQLGKKGKTGTGPMRVVLASRGVGQVAKATKLERLGLEVIERADLPLPVLEFAPLWADHLSFDAAYPEIKLAIEWDSRRWHTAIERFEHDRRRDRLAVIHGWVVLRFTWEDVTERPSRVAREVAKAIDSRRRLQA